MKSLYSALTKSELVDLAEVMDLSFSLSTVAEFRDVWRKLGGIIPFEHAICASASTDENGRFRALKKMVNISYPKPWVDFYVKNGCSRVDPILNTHFQRFQPFGWSEPIENLSRETAEFMSVACDFGLRSGVTSGMHSSGQGIATVFSFVGRDMEREPRHFRVVEKVTPHLHSALVRLSIAEERSAEREITLSKRERETLKWLVLGKTNWDISRILGISERTVRFHVENIFAKMGVSTRSQAVAVAFKSGLTDGTSAIHAEKRDWVM